MIAILGLISTGLSVLSSALGIAKIIKQWHKPAGYLIRFINWIGSMVDWVTLKADELDAWIDRTKIKVGIKKEAVKVEKETKRRRRIKYGRRRDR